METLTNPFAEIPDEVTAVERRVRRAAAEECQADHVFAGDLDRCVHAAVAAYWDSRIRAFVPLLALRRVRACLRAGSCATEEW